MDRKTKICKIVNLLFQGFSDYRRCDCDVTAEQVRRVAPKHKGYLGLSQLRHLSGV